MGNEGSYLCEYLPSCVNVPASWVSASLSFKGGIALTDGFYSVPESLRHHHLAGTRSHGDGLPAQMLLSLLRLWLLHPTAPAPDLHRVAAPALQIWMKAGAMQAGTGAPPSPINWTNKNPLMYVTHVLSLAVSLHCFEWHSCRLSLLQPMGRIYISASLMQVVWCQSVVQLPLSLGNSLHWLNSSWHGDGLCHMQCTAVWPCSASLPGGNIQTLRPCLHLWCGGHRGAAAPSSQGHILTGSRAAGWKPLLWNLLNART